MVILWAVSIGRVDILLEVALLSLNIALPRLGYLQALNKIFRYLKQVTKRKLHFDPVSTSISEEPFQHFEWEFFYREAEEAIPANASNPRGKVITTN